MSRRDRNPSAYGRYEGHYENPDEQQSGREWDRNQRPRMGMEASSGSGRDTQSGYAMHDPRYGARSSAERDFGHEPHESTRRFPVSFGSYDDQRRMSSYEDENYGRYSRDEGERPPQLRPSGWYNPDRDARPAYADRSNFGYGRDAAQARYGERGWGGRDYYAEPRVYGADPYGRENYGRENYEHEGYARESGGSGIGQQLREAGREVARKVKRVFRGPKGYKRSDDRIREDVNDRLSEQDRFDCSEIEVQVASGEVTLIGSVSSRHEKFLAEEIADDVNGVTEVHNQLRVRREQTALGSSSTQLPQSTAQTTQTTSDFATRNRNAHS